MPAAVEPLPTFLIIGAQKGATRWLRFNLGLHPDVFTAASELAFFNNGERYQSMGVAWYAAQFEGWTAERIVGEATPGYMMWRHHPEVVAERIDETLPGVRLVAILRNPVDRAQSAMVHHIKYEKFAPDAKLVDVVRATPPEKDPLGIVAGSWYGASLRPYVERFGDRLLVVLNEDSRSDPRRVYADVLRHIGADASFVPADLETVRFSGQQSAERPASAVSREERQQLYDEYFRTDVGELETMLGRDLSVWDPARS